MPGPAGLGDPGGAFTLGGLLAGHGDLVGALAAFQRADQRGDARSTLNVGVVLANQGHLAGAKQAYRRAAGRGDPALVEGAIAALAVEGPELANWVGNLGDARGRTPHDG